MQIRLVKGVTGGFVAPTPEFQILVDYNPTTKQFKIERAVKSGSDYKTTETSAKEHLALVEQTVAELQSLNQLPIEQPVGAQDIYRFDMSLSVQGDGFYWQNTPNQGCDIQESPLPSDDQRQHFKRLCDLIIALGQKAQ
ncbi:hypothetical protein EDD86DRAFT_250602 [Gorgonomyces haynaldii]|nr:hypothetical protein EDD86DRAFT_250602 [Gorgonomyces haynaldii]